MKIFTLIMLLLIGSTSAFSQTEDIKPSPVERQQATKGTYQLIFKDQASKDWFFAEGVKTASKYVGVGGITSYTDLLIVVHENRQKEKDQNFIIGENEEVTIKVLSLDFINSGQFQPINEFTFKK
jgi:hypothetical protein